MNRIAILMALVLTAIGVVGPGSAQALFTLTKSGVSYVGVVTAPGTKRVAIVTAPFDGSACAETTIAFGTDELKADTIVRGTQGQDSILFIAAPATFCGKSMEPLKLFRNHAFTVRGDAGTDFLIGNVAPVSLEGESGNDIVVAAASGIAKGGIGNDKVFGGGPDSSIYGGDGNDVMCAFGDDRNARVILMIGGSGNADERCGIGGGMSDIEFVYCANCTYTFLPI